MRFLIITLGTESLGLQAEVPRHRMTCRNGGHPSVLGVARRSLHLTPPTRHPALSDL